jgi:hypothetical protein
MSNSLPAHSEGSTFNFREKDLLMYVYYLHPRGFANSYGVDGVRLIFQEITFSPVISITFADNFTGTYNLLLFSELYMSMSFYP